MNEPEFLSVGGYAKSRALHQSTVAEAIKRGKITAYDANGQALPPDTRGPKFLKPKEADEARANSRSRSAVVPTVDPGTATADHASRSPSPPPVVRNKLNPVARSLTAARERVETLRAEKLQMELTAAQGDTIPRAAVVDALTIAFGELANEVSALVNYADDCYAAGQGDGVDGVRDLLRVISNQLRDNMARRLNAAAVLALKDEDDEADDVDDTVEVPPMNGHKFPTRPAAGPVAHVNGGDDFDDTVKVPGVAA